MMTGSISPFLSSKQVFQYLATADLGLDASLQFEVSPVKAMEYMAFGLPFVAFDLPETQAIGEGAAVLAKPGDVADHARNIDALLAAPERREALGMAGQVRVQTELSWEQQAVTYLKALDGCCPGTVTGRASWAKRGRAQTRRARRFSPPGRSASPCPARPDPAGDAARSARRTPRPSPAGGPVRADRSGDGLPHRGIEAGRDLRAPGHHAADGQDRIVPRQVPEEPLPGQRAVQGGTQRIDVSGPGRRFPPE